MEREGQFTIQKFEAKCPSFGKVVQVFLIKMTNNKRIQNGSDTSRTQMHHLSRDAKQRLKWMEHFRKYRNARLTCRHFGISPDTFYLWQKRFDSANLFTLEDNLKTRKPHRVRRPKYTPSYVENIKQLKEVNPKIGKTIISRILKEAGVPLSSSTVTRILKNILSS